LFQIQSLKNETTGHIILLMNKRDDKQQLILEAGLEEILLKGFNGTSVKDITVAANIPKGSFYNYFESKEHFGLEALHYVSSTSCENARLTLSCQQLPPLERLAKFYQDGALELEASNFEKGCLLGNLGQELSDANPVFQETVEKLMGKMTSQLEMCLLEAIEQGELNANICPKMMAEFLFNAWEGTITRMKTSKSKRPFTVFQNALRVLFGKADQEPCPN